MDNTCFISASLILHVLDSIIRGSPHVHGLLWIKGAKQFDLDIDVGDLKEQLEVARTFFKSLGEVVFLDALCSNLLFFSVGSESKSNGI